MSHLVQPGVNGRNTRVLRMLLLVAAVSVICGFATTGSASAAFTWSTASVVDVNQAAGQSLSDVACVSPSVCVTVDANGSEITFDPQSPAGAASHPIDPGQDVTSVSCPSSGQCTAADASGDEVTFAPSTGAVATTANLDAPQGGDGYVVACPSTTQCTAAGRDGGPAVTFNPQSPVTRSDLTLQTDALGSGAIECVSVTQCTIAPAGGSKMETFNPQSQTTTALIATQDVSFAEGLVCLSGSECVVVGSSGTGQPDYGASFNPTGASSLAETELGDGSSGAVAGVGCASATSCAAVSAGGTEITFDPSTQTVSTAVSIDSTAVDSDTCVSSSQCIAVDGAGKEISFTPTSPSTATSTRLDSAVGLGTVACATATDCVALEQGDSSDGSRPGNDANAVTFNPQSPVASQPTEVIPGATSTPDDDSAIGLLAVACASPTTCVAVGYDARNTRSGVEASFDPSSLSSATYADVPGSDLFAAVACPSVTECVAVDDLGDESTFSPTDAGDGQTANVDDVNEFDDLNAVACPTTTQCTAVDVNGVETTFDPTNPGQASSVTIHTDAQSSSSLNTLACPTTTQCTAIGEDGDAVTFNPQSGSVDNTVHLVSGVQAVQCVSRDDCVAVAQNGESYEGDPTTGDAWTSTRIANADALGGLTCLSSTECVTVDSAGSESLGVNGAIDPTTAAVSCAPTSVTLGTGTSCVATVTDIATSSTPTGTMSFSASPTSGAFGGGGTCTLAAAASAGVASCQLPFTPGATGSYTVTGDYQGDSTHATSTGVSTTVTVDLPSLGTPGGSGGTGGGTSGGAGAVAGAGRTKTEGSPKITHTTIFGTTANVLIGCSGSSSCALRLTLSVVETVKGDKVMLATASAGTEKHSATIKKTVVVGVKTVVIARGKSETVKLKLNRAGRRLLTAHRRLKTKLTVAEAGRTVASSALQFKQRKRRR
jgi:hypothetical protein